MTGSLNSLLSILTISKIELFSGNSSKRNWWSRRSSKISKNKGFKKGNRRENIRRIAFLGDK